jgi:hypothetical protein
LLHSQIAISVGCIEANLVKVFPAQAALAAAVWLSIFSAFARNWPRISTTADLRKGYALGTLIDKGKRGNAGWLYDESTTASLAHWKE